jgi:hypothetical protein
MGGRAENVDLVRSPEGLTEQGSFGSTFESATGRRHRSEQEKGSCAIQAWRFARLRFCRIAGVLDATETQFFDRSNSAG